MRLTPPPLQIGPKDGFDGTDIFEYAGFGKRFANLVCNVDQPLTVVLDGRWGSGKSTFVTQWSGLLRNNDVPVILFDAFANDHHEDAFTALAGEIVAVAGDRLGKKDSRTKRLVKSATIVGKAIMPFATRVAIRAGSVGLLSLDEAKDASEAAKIAFKELGDEAAKAAEKAVSERVTKAREESSALESFRQQLTNLAKEMSDERGGEGADGQRPPLVFIVDELDRCRPPFAVSLLERVKHLFSVPGVVFVLVTNLDQMTGAIRGAYGSETDGHAYMEKFYDLRVTLPVSQLPQDETRRRYIQYLWRAMELDSGAPRTDELIRDGLATLAQHHDIGLRTLERIATHVALTYASSEKETRKLVPLIVGLCAMRQIDRSLYERARSKKLVWTDIKEFLDMDNWENSSRAQGYTNWWRYFSDPDVDGQEEWFQKFEEEMFFRRGFDSRFDIIPSVAKQIDDFAVVERSGADVQRP